MAVVNRAIVTGPTGVLGTALLKHCSDRGIATVAIVRPESKRLSHINCIEGVQVVECDLSELSNLPNLLPPHDGESVFFHLGWGSTFGADARNNLAVQIANISYAVNAVHAAESLGCSVFIGIGSQAEYGRAEVPLTADTPVNPENGYGMAKLCAGQMARLECEKLGIRFNWVRVLSLYGPHDNPNTLVASVITKFLRGEKPSLTKGEQIWDYLFSEDAAEALLLIAEKGRAGTAYCLGSGEAKQLKEYVECIRDAINPKLEIGFGDIEYTPKQVMHLCANIESLRHDTGFSPATPFEVGIRKTIEWHRSVLAG